jgi:ribosome-associated protein
MEEISIHSKTINLDQLLKWAGIVDTGGQVKILIDAGNILVNNKIATERRKKINSGDVIEIIDAGVWRVTGT